MQEKTLLNQTNSTSNIHSMDFGAISYDIFGSPYQKTGSFLATDSLNFGYLGKPYNADTELYDYGFRDYSPEIARFNTVDPIRDGRNWFSYVVNDPVNFVDLWGLCVSESDGESEEESYVVYFIYVYKTNSERDQKMKESERNSINNEVKYLEDNNIAVKIIENGTFTDIKKALEDPNIKLLVTSGHGRKSGSIETADAGTFSPSDLMNINVSESLETVIFENCYQGGSSKDTNDNEKKWEDAFGGNIDVVGWQDTTTTSETQRFNNWGLFDRQSRNLMSYCKEIVKEKEL